MKTLSFDMFTICRLKVLKLNTVQVLLSKFKSGYKPTQHENGVV